MNLLRRVLLIGVLATLVDVGGLLVLVEVLGWPVWLADAVAVAAATLVSFLLHTARTGQCGCSMASVVRQPRALLEHRCRGAGGRCGGADLLARGLLRPGWWLPLTAGQGRVAGSGVPGPQLQLPQPDVPGGP